MRKRIFLFLMLVSIGILAATGLSKGTKLDDPKPVSTLTASLNEMKVTLNWGKPDYTSTVFFESFDNKKIPDGWSNVDADGDGRKWGFDGYWNDGGTDYWIGSWSWYFNATIMPDNWLITKKFKVGQGAKLKYSVGSLDSEFMDETYAVYLSETTNNVQSFTKELFKETLSAGKRSNEGKNAIDKRNAKGPAVFYDRSIDLKDYVGKEVYIAFRHFEGKEAYCINLNDVFVKNYNSQLEIPAHSYNIYRNGKLIKNTTDNTLVDDLEKPGTYEYEVAVLYETGELSVKKSVYINIPDTSKKAYIILEAHAPFEDGTGYQIYLDNTATQYGQAIPSSLGALTQTCDIPEDLPGKFSHSVPENADMSCDAVNIIVDGESEIVEIPAGKYDLCVVNPTPGRKIWIASGSNGRLDDFVFEEGKLYRFKAEMNPSNPSNDHVVITSTPYEVYAPVEDLEGSANDGTVTLNWTSPHSSESTATIFKETFEDGFPDNWTTIDVDGDGHNWEYYIFSNGGHFTGHNGGKCVSSASWKGGGIGPLTPDNYLITPELDIPAGAQLSFWLCAQDANYAAENWKLYASTTGNKLEDFTELLHWGTMTPKEAKNPGLDRHIPTRVQGAWFPKIVDLPEGTKYLAFRHYNDKPFFWLNLDDVEITAPGDTPNAITYSVYRDGEMIADKLSEPTFVDEALEDGRYEYCVKADYTSGSSEQVCIEVKVGGENLPTISDLQVSADNNANVSLSWKAPVMRGPVVLSESFENGLPDDWATIDADGDGYGWIIHGNRGFMSKECISSASYMNYGVGALTPDNYLITPELDLPNGGELSFYVCAQDNNNPGDHWAVYASNNGSTVADFVTPLMEETLVAKEAGEIIDPEFTRDAKTREQGTWYKKTVELPAGTKHVAFRHFNCEDKFWINLDVVKISTNNNFTYNVYRNGTQVASELVLTDFTENHVPAGDQEYCVEVVYPTAISDRVCKTVNVPQSTSLNPIRDLEVKQITGTQDVEMSWMAPIQRGTIILNEKFEEGLPTRWTTIDADGDGYTWMLKSNFVGYLGGKCISSASWMGMGVGPLTPDNYLVTEALHLPAGGKLSYWVCAQDVNYPAEEYAIYASKNGNTLTDFTQTTALHEETLGVKEVLGSNGKVQATWYMRSIDLPAGTKYVAFRHHSKTANFWINIDDVCITSEGGASEYSYNIFRDSELIAEGIKEGKYIDKNVSGGSHNFGVQVKYPHGVSTTVSKYIVVVTSIDDATATKPYSLQVIDKKIVVEANGLISLFDVNGQLMANGEQQVEYDAINGVYILRVIVDDVAYVEKIAIR